MIIKVESKREYYEFDLKRKVTVIRGESGRGKSSFVSAATDTSGAYKKYYSAKGFVYQELTGENWADVLSGFINLNKRYIFLIDDEDFVVTSTFSDLYMRDTHNYYIIINRHAVKDFRSLSQIPFAVDSVYDFKTSGRKHWLEPHYKIDSVYQSAYDVVVTEDRGSGFRFLKNYNEQVSTAKGNSNVYGFLKRNISQLRGKRIFLFADLAVFGPYLDSAYGYAKYERLNITLFPDYDSFDYLLLISNFFKYDINSISENMMLRYASHEKLYEAVIKQITKGKPYYYDAEEDKGTLSSCYLVDCCDRPRTQPCDKGVRAIKKDYLFKNTIFETLFQFIEKSNLIQLR